MKDTNVLKINYPQAVCGKAHKNGVYTFIKKARWSMCTSLCTLHSVVPVHIRSLLPYQWKRHNFNISEAGNIY